MDRERLTKLLQDPSLVAKQDLADLRSMAEHFPWFSGARLLLAVGEHGTGDVLANDRHSTPAAYLPSRAVLFDLVQKEEQPAAPMHVVKDDVPFTTEAPSPEPVQGTENEVAPTSKSTPAPAPDASATHEGTIKDEVIKDTIAAPEARAPVAKEPEPPLPDPVEMDILEIQIQEAVRASGYDLGQLGTVPPKAGPVVQAPSAPPPPMPPPAVPVEPASQPPVATSSEADAPEPVTGNTRLSFVHWLERSTEQPPPNASDEPEPAPSAINLEAGAISQPPALAPLSPDFSPTEIMEQFIQRSAPPPNATKATFFNPQKAAKQSLQDEGLVSETLARIHEEQGHFAKAKEVYDRLALKHPEKSVYFAALSKALEARM